MIFILMLLYKVPAIKAVIPITFVVVCHTVFEIPCPAGLIENRQLA
jgi:hypothetical protein